LYIRSCSIWKQKLGSDHPDVATSLNNLASLYELQGKYAKAGYLYMKALKISKQHLGLQHSHTKMLKQRLTTLKTSGLYVPKTSQADVASEKGFGSNDRTNSKRKKH
jgi:tetratricopeptide (TPR) repeat protein